MYVYWFYGLVATTRALMVSVEVAGSGQRPRICTRAGLLCQGPLARVLRVSGVMVGLREGCSCIGCFACLAP